MIGTDPVEQGSQRHYKTWTFNPRLFILHFSHLASHGPISKSSSDDLVLSSSIVIQHLTELESPFSIWPHLFRVAGHEKKRGEQLKSLA